MIDIKRTFWSSIQKGACFILNKDFLERTFGCDPKLKERIGCLLSVVEVKNGKYPARDKALFRCISRAPSCRDHKELLITRMDLGEQYTRSSGNLLIRIYEDICHSCGKYSTRCLSGLYGHYLCLECYAIKKADPPFDYGKGSMVCCRSSGCGNKAAERRSPYDSDVMVYKRAVAIQRYRTK